MTAKPRQEAEALSHHHDFERGPQRAILALIAVSALFLALSIAWMSFARLDISVNASGSIIPSNRLQQVQSMEGGILQSLTIREGMQVRKGEVLAVVQNLQFSAEQGESLQTLWSVQAALLRLEAEARNRQLSFPPDLERKAPEIVREQRNLWQSRQQERSHTLEALAKQLAQREQELSEVRTRLQALSDAIGPARESLAIEEQLSLAGAGARADLLAAQQRFSAQKGELETTRIAVGRVQSAVQEAQARLNETRSRFQTETSKEKSEFELRAATLKQQLTSRNDRVERREIRSPLDGEVNRILLNTVGGVVKAGETIMEVVPNDDRLLISARVKPADIAFIRTGQEAKIRITAYDSSIFGSIPGKVLRLGADAVLDNDRKESFFEVTIVAEQNFLGRAEERLSLSPGMVADVSIHTGKRTVLEYLLKPMVKTLDKSLRER